MLDLKKHLLLTLEYPPNSGGVGVYLKNLVDNSKAYDFTVLKHREQNKCSAKTITEDDIIKSNFFYKYFWPKWLKVYFFVKKLNKAKGFDILHISHILPLGYVAYLLFKTLNLPYVIYLHGLDFNLMKSSKWKSYWGKKILSNAKVIVTNSKFLQKEVREFVNNNVVTIYPIPNQKLLQYTNINDENKILKIKEHFNINNTHKILLTVGRLVKRKGQHLVVEAISRLEKDYKYFIIGKGAGKSHLKSLIKKYNLEKQVYILDNITDEELAYYYKMADLFVMPTLKLGNDVEGFGIVYLEANAFSLPVIAGEGDGVREAVSHNQSGLLLDNVNIDMLVENIDMLFQKQDLYDRLRKDAKQHYKNYLYQPDHLFKKIDKFI